MPLSSNIPIPTHINATDAMRMPKPVPAAGYQKVKKTDKGTKNKTTSEDNKKKDTERSEQNNLKSTFDITV